MTHQDMPVSACSACRDGTALPFGIAMAFQPIVDIRSGQPFAYEALVRGTNGESAHSVLSAVSDDLRYAFDQACRVAAIEGAVAAGIMDTGARLSINFLPNAVYSPKACIRLTLATAAAVQFPTDRLLFEFTENEEMPDPAHVAAIVAAYREMGFGTALDDFGAGHAGLTLLARFQPDYLKLDMELVRGLDNSLPRRMIVEAVLRMCTAMGIGLVAEGIETEGELAALREIGIHYVQGYLLARPGFRTLPSIRLPGAGLRSVAH
jgi:EAL domain-containing protein (putative c-di-GMP-specific phosphodiesterase class I)